MSCLTAAGYCVSAFADLRLHRLWIPQVLGSRGCPRVRPPPLAELLSRGRPHPPVGCRGGSFRSARDRAPSALLFVLGVRRRTAVCPGQSPCHRGVASSASCAAAL
eukprot:4321602-Alexandrium_andersonii.AAC.1